MLELRSPDGADAAAVLAYIRALSKEAYRYLNHPPAFFEAMTLDVERAFLEGCAAHRKNVLIAASLDGLVIGTTNISIHAASFSPHCAELGLGVLEPYRKMGVGRLLMETLIEAANAVGVWNLHLRVRTFNAPAIALYESLGFRRVGVLEAVAELPDGLADEYMYQRIGSGPASR